MFYGHNLKSNLQEWRAKLYKSNHYNIPDSLRFFFDRLENSPIIRSILQTTIDNYPLSDELIDEYSHIIFEEGLESIHFENEEHAASLLYRVYCNLSKKHDALTLCLHLGLGQGEEQVGSFIEFFIEPIISLIQEKIEESNFVLYLLEKYKMRVEWFQKDALLRKYRSDSRNSEQVLEDDLRLYLFDQGIDYPFSNPKSASGRADIVGLIDTKNPLILEIKIYDSARTYKKDRIIDGFSQIVKYSNDYNKNVGFLVVYNLDNIEIEICSEQVDKTFPNRVTFNNKVYYIVIVNLNNDVSASKTGTLKTAVVTTAELTSQVK